MFHIIIKVKSVSGSEELIAAEAALPLEELLYVDLYK
jgi:hypothetical protein